MKTILKLSKTVNIIALVFLLLGPYGIAITGALQLLAAVIYLTIYYYNRLIYIYFGLVIVFFIFWERNFDWLFSIPIFLNHSNNETGMGAAPLTIILALPNPSFFRSVFFRMLEIIGNDNNRSSFCWEILDSTPS